MRKEFKTLKITRSFKYNEEKQQYEGNLDKCFALIPKDVLDLAIGEDDGALKALSYVGTIIEGDVIERATAKADGVWIKVESIKSISHVKTAVSSMSEDPVLSRVREGAINGQTSSLGYHSITKVMDRLRENNRTYKEVGYPDFYQTPSTIKSFLKDISTKKAGNKDLSDILFGVGAVKQHHLDEIKEIYDDFVNMSRIVVEQEEEFPNILLDDTPFMDPFSEQEIKVTAPKAEIKQQKKEIPTDEWDVEL